MILPSIRISALCFVALVLVTIVIGTRYLSPDRTRSQDSSSILLGTLSTGTETATHFISPKQAAILSFHLYGHIAHRENPASFLQQPVLALERQEISAPSDLWQRIAEASAPSERIHVARIQNQNIDPAYRYRLTVRTLAKCGGSYALITEKAQNHVLFEIEDIDMGTDKNGTPYTICSVHVAEDPNLLSGKRIVIGTDQGAILQSLDHGESWQVLLPAANYPKLEGPVFSVFQDRQGTLYASPWLDTSKIKQGCHGYVLESRDHGITWIKAMDTWNRNGVAWRFAEDAQGTLFVGEYTSCIHLENAPIQNGIIWRRKNDQKTGKMFEIVFQNPSIHPDRPLNHVHFIGVDPYTQEVYATLGDGAVGKAIRSRQGGDPGSWKILETGVDSQYTAAVFTPDYIYWGQDTNKPYKKIVRWPKHKERIEPSDWYTTSYAIDYPRHGARKWKDKGNWFWGHSLPSHHLVIMQYLPYGTQRDPEGYMQCPRLYACDDRSNTWWRALTFPPVPESKTPPSGFWGPKYASNRDSDGWIYCSYATIRGVIHPGFRFRVLPEKPMQEKNSQPYREIGSVSTSR